MLQEDNIRCATFKPPLAMASKHKLQRNVIIPMTKTASVPVDQESQTPTMSDKKTAEFFPAEKMLILHERLKQECDKITMRQNATELELKQKEWKLQEANTIIDMLRKNMVELQHENEKANLKVQDEITCRADIIQRVRGSRDMCVFLKEYTNKIENKYQDCLKEKDELLKLQAEQESQIQDLCVKFTQFQANVDQQHNSLLSKVQGLENEKKVLVEEYSAALSNSDLKILSLSQEIDEKNLAINAAMDQLKCSQAEVNQMQESLAILQSKVSDGELLNSELKSILDEINHELANAKENNAQLVQDKQHKEEELHVMTEELAKKQESFDETVDGYNKSLQGLQHGLCESNKKIAQLNSALTEANNNLEYSKEECTMARARNDKLAQELATYLQTMDDSRALMNDYKSQCDHLQQAVNKARQTADEQEDTIEQLRIDLTELAEQNKQLEADVRASNIKISQLLDDRDTLKLAYENELKVVNSLQNELRNACTERKASLGTLKDLQADLTAAKEALDKALAETCTSKAVLQEEQAKNDQLEKEAREAVAIRDKLKSELELQAAHIKELETELQVLRQDLHIRNLDSSHQVSSLAEEIKNRETIAKKLEQLRKESDEQVTRLTDQVTEDSKLIAELREQLNITDIKLKRAETVHEKLKSCKAELLTKSKTIKDLEKQTKLVKQEMEKLSTSVEDKEVCCKEMADTLQQLKDQLADFQHQVASKTESNELLRKRFEATEQERNQAKCDLEEATKRFETRMKDVECVMEKYKLDNEQIVAKKHKQLQEANKRAERVIEAENEVKQLQITVEKLTVSLETSNKELEMKAAALAILEKKLESLHLAQSGMTMVEKTPRKVNKDFVQPKTPVAGKANDYSKDVSLSISKTPTSLSAADAVKTPTRLTPSIGQAKSATTPKVQEVGSSYKESSARGLKLTPQMRSMSADGRIKSIPIPVRTSTPQPEEDDIMSRDVKVTASCGNTKRVKFVAKSDILSPLNSSMSSLSMSFDFDKDWSKGKSTESKFDNSGRKRTLIKTPSNNWLDEKNKKIKSAASPQPPTTNVKKCSAKTPGKFFLSKKFSDDKKAKGKGKHDADNLLWMDNDSTFGLNFDD